MRSATKARLLFSALMAFMMALIMSFVITWLNTGMDSAFMGRWLPSFGVAVIVAFPVSLLVAPIAQRLTSWLLVDDNDGPGR